MSICIDSYEKQFKLLFQVISVLEKTVLSYNDLSGN